MWRYAREYAVSDVVRTGTILTVNGSSPLYAGTTISVPAVIASAINAGLLETSPTSFVTFIMTDGVDDGGRCQYCGYHRSFHAFMNRLTVPNAVNFAYLVIPPVNPSGGTCQCDQVAAVAHELLEVAVNSAYYDFAENMELMDLCESLPSVPQDINGTLFYLPQVWSNALNACSNGTTTQISPVLHPAASVTTTVTAALSALGAVILCGLLLAICMYRQSRAQPPPKAKRRKTKVYAEGELAI